MPVQTRSQTRALAQASVPVPAPTLAKMSKCAKIAEEMKTRLGHVSELDLEPIKTSIFVKVPTSVLPGDVFTVNVAGETHYIKCPHSMTSSRLVKINTASKSTSIVLNVTVPEDAIPGDTFLVRYNDKLVSVRCPLNATPGSQISAVIDK